MTATSYSYVCNHHCLNGFLQCVQASVVAQCRDIDTNTCGSILGAVDSTSEAIKRCYLAMLHTHTAYCLFSARRVAYNTVHKRAVVKRKKTEKVSLFNSSHSYYTHSITTSTDCHLMHYSWLTVILRTRNALRRLKRFCGALVPKSPLIIYANQMLPVPTTLLPKMTQAGLEQLTA